jgi:hypothetical protein
MPFNYVIFDPDTGEVENIIVAESAAIAEQVVPGRRAARTDGKPGQPGWDMRFSKGRNQWEKKPEPPVLPEQAPEEPGSPNN